MKVLGIITEYNPFHQGHQLHIKKSLEKSNADATICVMSGSFLQRGEPALINQWSRTKIALNYGVDLMIQLPTSYSIRSAEHFAYGAIKLLTASGIVDYVCFGSEYGRIKPLQIIGELLAREPQKLSQLIRKQLETGNSYPKARSQALIDYLTLNSNNLSISPSQLKAILNTSNNILGIEYIKALTKLNSSIIPLTIQREGSGYHTDQLKKLASASAIRKQIKKNHNNNQLLIDENLSSLLPDITVKTLKEEFKKGLGPIFYDDFSTSILTLLRRINSKKLQQYEDVTGGLENRIKDAAHKATSLSELISLIKTKRFTKTRIQRILTQILFNLNTSTLSNFDQAGGPQYLRILGFNQQGRKLLKKMKTKANLPIITKVANHFRTDQNPNNLLQEMISYDLKANNLYSLAYPNQQARQGGIDFYQQPIIISSNN